MPLMVLSRNYRLASTLGHMINFKKGEPIWVPKPLVNAAVALGAAAVDGTAEVTLAEDVKEPQLAGDERQEAFMKAFKVIVARNGREDFTGAGYPHCRALEKILGFEPLAAERNAMWKEYLDAEGAQRESEAA